MGHSKIKLYSAIFLTIVLGLFAAWGRAQTTSPAPQPSHSAQNSGRSIEDLNFIGADAVMPLFSDSAIDLNSGFRRALFKKGMALRLVQTAEYAQNTLRAPVAADQQVYVGEHPFGWALEHLIFTADLRQFRLQHAQFCGSGVWNWVSWNPAGPKAFQIWDLYLYKAFGNGRVEMKAGYISNNLEFVGLTVGGSTATAAQGVYAVLPYELGLSYFPLTTPSLNVRVRGPRQTYVKVASQRSLDPQGGPMEVSRNHTGFRFIPHGDKLLLVSEAGYMRNPTATARYAWLRLGYMHNSSPYINFATSRPESGNHAAFVLADYQLLKPGRLQPEHGLYLGATAMTADSRFNAYDRYYEARLYRKAPFRSRPFDMASLVAYYTGHSSRLTDSLVASSKTVWRNGASVTGSYSLRVRSGQYMSIGLSYIHGPAITPRVNDALTFSAGYSVFL